MPALPRYELAISMNPESELQVSAIALVDKPAIQRNFIAFNDSKPLMRFSEIKDDERLVVGPAMIPNLVMYRREELEDGTIEEYEAFFSEKTVESVAEKFFMQSFQQQANLMHDPNQKVEGLTFFLSWIKCERRGMVGLDGDYPEGTWFVGARVNNEEVWGKIKSGEIQGFSVEGWFAHLKKPSKDPDEQLMEKIAAILNGTE